MKLWTVLLGSSLLLAAGCGGETRATHDPPRIVPWTSIGSVEIGSSRGQVHDLYGRPSSRESLRKYWPVGTKYASRNVNDETYRVPGGTIYVRYVDDVVKMVQTTSPRYKTPDGIHVGSRLSRGRCRGEAGNCSYEWRGFVFDDCTNSWYLAERKVDVEVAMDRSLFEHENSRVDSIGFGDPDVVLHCF